MGKASSAKKVARAARAGGRVSSGQPRSLLFPSVLALVIVLGTALVVYAREDRRNEDLGGTPQLRDHIHQALGINVCGEWLTDLPEFETVVGILTDAGIEGERRVIALRALLAFVLGAIQLEHLGPLPGEGTREIAALPATRFPLMAETARQAAGVGPEQEFRHGLALLLDGLAGAAGPRPR